MVTTCLEYNRPYRLVIVNTQNQKYQTEDNLSDVIQLSDVIGKYECFNLNHRRNKTYLIVHDWFLHLIRDSAEKRNTTHI